MTGSKGTEPKFAEGKSNWPFKSALTIAFSPTSQRAIKGNIMCDN